MDVTQRGQLTEEDKTAIIEAWMASQKATGAYKRLIAQMVEKSSYREVAAATNLSTNTLQRWVKEVTADA